MKLAVLQEKTMFLVPVFLVLFTFFMPISQSLKSIFLISSLVLIILTPYYNKLLFYTFNTLWGRAICGFFLYIIIACFWSQAPFSMQTMMVGKYAKVLFLPILAVGFMNPKTRYWTINAYLAAMVLTCIISMLKAMHVVGSGDPGEVFSNRIMTGFMIAFGCYLAGVMAYQNKGRGRLVYLFLMSLLSYQIIFINTSKTGYVLYFMLMIFLLVQILSIKKAIAGILLFCSIFLLCYTQSSVMQERFNSLVTEVKVWKENNKNTSLGFRIQFHDYARSLLMTHPVIGIGTGGFKYSVKRDNPFPTWGDTLHDPHSQYWLTLSEQGIIGFLSLMIFLGSLLIAALQLKETRLILLGALVSFCIGALSDSILCYSAAGFVLIIMSALCLGELVEKHALKESRFRKLNVPVEDAFSAFASIIQTGHDA